MGDFRCDLWQKETGHIGGRGRLDHGPFKQFSSPNQRYRQDACNHQN
jgi:hypothetical protein